MTYDISFVRRSPGQTLLEALEELGERYDPDAEPEPMHLTPTQRAAWERIVQRISRELGPATAQEYPHNFSLDRDGPAGHLLLHYDGESASIEIPYWYPGEAALPIVTEAYHIARIVEEETGLEGFDAQLDQATAVADIETAARSLGGTAQWVQENLT